MSGTIDDRGGLARAWGGPAGDLLLMLALGLAAAAALAAAPARLYTFDAVSYAWQIEQFARTGAPRWLFHPHHLLFNGAGYLAWRLLRGLAGVPRPLEAVQWLNAAAGGAAVAFCYAAARRGTGSRLLGLGVALVIGVSNGLWLIATDGGIYALGFALFAAALWVALRLMERPARPLAAGLGALAAMTALVHQMHVLLLPAIAIAAVVGGKRAREPEAGPVGPASAAAPPPTPRTGALSLLGSALGAYALVFGGAYCLAGAALGHWRPADFLYWITSYGHDGRWWDFRVARNLHLDLAALVRDLTAGPDPVLARLEHPSVPLAIAGLGIMALAGFLAWRAWRVRGREILFCLAWLAPYAAFFTIWVPGYYPYWVPVVLGLLLVGCLLLDGALRSLPSPRAPAIGGAARLGAAAMMALAAWRLWGINGPAAAARGRADANPYLAIATEVRQRTRGAAADGRPSDLILMAGPGDYAAVEVYVPYFAGRDVVTVAHALKHHGPGSGRSREEALAWLRDNFRERWRGGAQVYALRDVLRDPAAFESLEQLYGMTLADSQAFMREFRLEPAFAVRKQPVYRLAARREGK